MEVNKLKTCQKCGNVSKDEARFCNICGYNFENVTPTQQQTNPNQYDYNPNRQINNSQNMQTPNYQQQNNYQNTYQVPNQKIKYLAPILNIIGGIFAYILSGIGHLYLGLYKRGIIICLLGLVPLIIGSIIILTVNELAGTLISLIIGVALVIYSAYDAHQCTLAINERRSIPLLFGRYDIE